MHRKKYKNIDAYIKDYPKSVQTRLQKIRQTIEKAVPETDETISYGIPTVKIHGKYLLYFAAYEHHIGMYPILKASQSLTKEMQPYKSGKSTLKFPHDKPVPYGLVKKIALARLKQRQVK